MITSNPTIDVKTPPTVLVWYLDSGVAIFGCLGSPEGAVAALVGSFAVDVQTGDWYRKASGIGNTGWVLTGGAVSGALRGFPPDVTVVGNGGAGLDPLHSFTLPAGSLATNGDYLDVGGDGFYSSTANQKRLVLSFDGQDYNDTGLRDADEPGINLGWKARSRITRLSATTVRVSSSILTQFFGVDAATAPFTGGGGFAIVKNVDLTVANLDANPVVIAVEGEGTANNDVVQNLSTVQIYAQ